MARCQQLILFFYNSLCTPIEFLLNNLKSQDDAALYSKSVLVPLFYYKFIWRDLPVGAVTKTLFSQCRGPGFDPWSANYITHAATKTWPNQRNFYIVTYIEFDGIQHVYTISGAS